MKNNFKFYIKKKSLLAIAGIVWMIAGINVLRMGVLAYFSIQRVYVIHIVLSIFVFGIFGTMFGKMTIKHSNRIQLYEEEKRPFWNFFDLKSYLIMICMMSVGIGLRLSGWVSSTFIAVFYTGLGFALTMAGVFFEWIYFVYSEEMN